MSQYNNRWRFPAANDCSGYGNMRNVGPTRFGSNYGPGQRHNRPPFHPRHGPPRWANTYSMWRNRNNSMEPPSSPASAQHSPTTSVTTPPRPKGPRTPPDPPPEDQPSIERYRSPSKERSYGSTKVYNDYHSNDEKRRNQHRAPQDQFYKSQHQNMRGRRNSHPLSMPHHQMTSFQNTCNNSTDYDSYKLPVSDTEIKPPSALNTAVQSYLLQVLTAQPPPTILPTQYHPHPSTSLPQFQNILPHSSRTPPPLPPTPVRSATPPPPPSDEENWDTPSEASNDATSFKLNSPNQEKVPNIEDNVADTLASTQICDVAQPDVIANSYINTNENHTATLETTAPRDANTDGEHDDSVGQMDYTSFKIKIPSRVDGLAPDVDSVEVNIMKDALNKHPSLESAFTTSTKICDVAQPDVIANSYINANENHTATFEMTAPSDANTEGEHDDSVGQMDYTSFKIKIPSRVDGLAPDVDSVEVNIMKDALNKHPSLESALTIDIPNREDITSSNANQEHNSLDKLESILKIVTPKNTNPNEEDNNADRIDVPFRITLPHREISQSQERLNVEGNADQTLTKTKSKRRKNSGKSTSKVWPLELAERALGVEQELLKEVSKDNVLILRFPDPPLSREMVKDFCEEIESVHFQQNSAPRYCFVHLKEGVDVGKSIETLSKIPFGTGLIKAELRNVSIGKPCSAKADNIDPFTLYVGNLSPTVPCKVLKEHFPGASRINIGFAQRMKHTRYAFIQYQKVDDAIAAYRRMFKSEIEGRSLIIRFKRLGAAATADGESQMHGGFNNDDEEDHVDTCSMISTSTMPSDMTEDTAITTAESDRNDCVASVDTHRELNQSEDYCVGPNVPQLDQECEISQPATNQTTLETVSDNVGGLQDKSNDVVNVNKNSESFCGSNDLVNSNESTGLNRNDFNVQPVDDPKECAIYKSATQTATQSTAIEEFENFAYIESTKHSNSNTVQSLTSEREQVVYVDDTPISRSARTVKSEQPISGVETNERIVYSMPRPSQRLENVTTEVDIKSKCELNEDYEFFSVRRTSVSALEVETERPSSANSYCSSIEFANACFSDQYLETIEMSKAVQRRKRGKEANEAKEALSQDLLKNISIDMNLLSQALKNKIKSTRIKHDLSSNHDILLIDDEISMTPSSGRRHCESQSDMLHNSGNNDDLVPSTALLLRRDIRQQSIDAASTNPYAHSHQQVKNEYLKCETQKDGVHNPRRKLKEQNFIAEIRKDTTQTKSIRNNGSRKRKSPCSLEDAIDMKPVVPNDGDDADDVVPANCALHLFQKSITFFDLTLDEDPIMQLKREAETEDLFSLPKRTDKGKRPMAENNNSDSMNDGNISRSFRTPKNNKQQCNGLKSINEEWEPHCADDDDVVIITDDISPPTQQNLSISQCLSYPNQKDTLKRIKHENNSPTSIEKSFFDKHKRPSQHRDNLDRLFALLNSNSDEDS